jgi:hypothetical protein
MRTKMTGVPNMPTPVTRHAPPRVTVFTPRQGEIVTVGHPVVIRWHVSCVPGLLLHYVQLSTDGGTTYPWNISPLLDGQHCHFLWLPTDDVVTHAAQIRVVAINWGEATNEGPFIIQRAAGACSVSATPIRVRGTRPEERAAMAAALYHVGRAIL